MGRWMRRWLGGNVGYRTTALLGSQRSHHNGLAACTLLLHTRYLVPVPSSALLCGSLSLDHASTYFLTWHTGSGFSYYPVTCAAAAAAAAGEGYVFGCALFCRIVGISNGKTVLSRRCIF